MLPPSRLVDGALCILLVFLNDTPHSEVYTLSLHDALPILEGQDCEGERQARLGQIERGAFLEADIVDDDGDAIHRVADRKSTRLNSSHANISYAVFCLKKKKNT